MSCWNHTYVYRVNRAKVLWHIAAERHLSQLSFSKARHEGVPVVSDVLHEAPASSAWGESTRRASHPMRATSSSVGATCARFKLLGGGGGGGGGESSATLAKC